MKLKIEISKKYRVGMAFHIDGDEPIGIQEAACEWPCSQLDVFRIAQGTRIEPLLFWCFYYRLEIVPDKVEMDGEEYSLKTYGHFQSDYSFVTGEIATIDELADEALRDSDMGKKKLVGSLIANNELVAVRMLGGSRLVPFRENSVLYAPNGDVIERGDSDRLKKFRAEASVAAAKTNAAMAAVSAGGFRPRVVH